MTLQEKQARMRERNRPLVYKTVNGWRAHPKRPPLPAIRPLARGLIYLVGSHTHGWYKIGLSHEDSIDNRLCAYRTLPFGIDLELTWLCPHVQAVEKLLHDVFASRNVSGEWFRFDVSELARVQTAIVQTIAGKNVAKW